LKMIQGVCGIGTDAIDLETAKEAGEITVCKKTGPARRPAFHCWQHGPWFDAGGKGPKRKLGAWFSDPAKLQVKENVGVVSLDPSRDNVSLCGQKTLRSESAGRQAFPAGDWRGWG